MSTRPWAKSDYEEGFEDGRQAGLEEGRRHEGAARQKWRRGVDALHRQHEIESRRRGMKNAESGEPTAYDHGWRIGRNLGYEEGYRDGRDDVRFIDVLRRWWRRARRILNKENKQ